MIVEPSGLSSKINTLIMNKITEEESSVARIENDMFEELEKQLADPPKVERVGAQSRLRNLPLSSRKSAQTSQRHRRRLPETKEARIAPSKIEVKIDPKNSQ
jgi:hypothetical protein